jgi:hypothetical protein
MQEGKRMSEDSGAGNALGPLVNTYQGKKLTPWLIITGIAGVALLIGWVVDAFGLVAAAFVVLLFQLFTLPFRLRGLGGTVRVHENGLSYKIRKNSGSTRWEGITEILRQQRAKYAGSGAGVFGAVLAADMKYTIQHKGGEVVLHSAVVNQVGKLIKDIGMHMTKHYVSRIKEGEVITIGNISLNLTGICDDSSGEDVPWEQVKQADVAFDGPLQNICIYIKGKRKAWAEVPAYAPNSATPNAPILEWVVNELATGK